jgi:hypothetical protein
MSEREKHRKIMDDRLNGNMTADEAKKIVPMPAKTQDSPPGSEQAERQPQPWDPVLQYIPEGYSIAHRGVLSWGKNDSELISGPCWVTALTRSDTGDEWGREVRWIDQDGHERRMAFPMQPFHVPRSPLAPNLASMGLKVVPGKERQLVGYLAGFHLPRSHRVRSVSQLGWLSGDLENPVFVLPDGPIGMGQGEEIVFQPEEHCRATYSMRRRGNLDQWIASIARACIGNPFLVFSLCVGFTGPLLRFANIDSGGFHLYGASSKGKTTALQVSASIWGCGADPAALPDSYIGRWNTTANALEATAAAHNDLLLALDEIGTCDARDVGKVIYDLFGGTGKSRLNKNATLRVHRSWRTQGLSTGEVSLRQKIEEASGRPAKAGTLVRMLDIPIHEGVVKDSHGRPPGKFVNRLKSACGRFYGTAGAAFLERLVTCEPDTPSLQRRIQPRLDHYSAHLAHVASTDGEVLESVQQRAVRRLALVIAAGELAIEFGILPLALEEVLQSVMAIQQAWLGDADNEPECVRGIRALRDCMLRNEAHFRRSGDQRTVVRDLVGYIDTGQDLYLFTDQGIKDALHGYPWKTVLAELDRRGFVFKNEGRRLKSKHHIEGKGRLRLYAIRASFLEDELRKKT